LDAIRTSQTVLLSSQKKKISDKDGNIELDYEMKTHIQSLKAMLFDSTLVFGGIFSSEGDDRATLNWESK